MSPAGDRRERRSCLFGEAQVAILAAFERIKVRWLLIDRFAAEPDLATALETLYETHASRLPELPPWVILAGSVPIGDAEAGGGPIDAVDPDVAASVGAVRGLAQAWGLDRRIPEREERGARLVHGCCRSRRGAGRELPVGRLADGLTEAHRVAEIGEVVARSVTDLRDMRVVDELVRPIVRIERIDEWDPMRESRADARKRLRARTDAKIRDELDRLSPDAESKGYRSWTARRPWHATSIGYSG